MMSGRLFDVLPGAIKAHAEHNSEGKGAGWSGGLNWKRWDYPVNTQYLHLQSTPADTSLQLSRFPPQTCLCKRPLLAALSETEPGGTH